MVSLLTVAEAAESLRLSRATVYQLLADGRLESVRVGRARRIPVAAVTQFVEQLRDEAGAR